MKKIYLTTIQLLLVLLNASSQNTRICVTEEYNNNLMQYDAAFKKNQEVFNAQVSSFINNRTSGAQVPIYIPVVFHVVYNTAAQNISTARILDQLEVLNDDYQRLNADTVNTPSVFLPCAAASEIHFCLAQRDPNGQSTSGIVTVQTNQTSFSQNDNVKFTASGGDDIWPHNDYFNIWICNLASGITGYATLPGGNALTDGVVLHYECVGGPNAPGTMPPFNLGRVGTHMTGHWLNLIHFPVNCDSSIANVCQPSQPSMPLGCPTFPDTSCNGNNSPHGTMFMNYMQGTDDNCMNIFNLGQLVRMNLTMSSFRSALPLSLGCLPVSVNETNNIENNWSFSPNPSSETISLIFNSHHNAPMKCEIMNTMGDKLFNFQIPNIKFQTTLDVSGLASGIYVVRVGDGKVFDYKKLVIE
jgi:hypothetical protein